MTSEVGPARRRREGRASGRCFSGVSVFACANGNVERFEFADIGCTATAGLSLSGQPVGIAGVGRQLFKHAAPISMPTASVSWSAMRRFPNPGPKQILETDFLETGPPAHGGLPLTINNLAFNPLPMLDAMALTGGRAPNQLGAWAVDCRPALGYITAWSLDAAEPNPSLQASTLRL